jgi:competence protein ComEA
MKRFILQFLYFSRGDARASVFLVFICLSSTMAPSVLKKHLKSPDGPEPKWKNELLAAMDRLEREQENPDTLRPFVFDPNTVSLDSLLDMNVPVRIARRLIKYRDKGGQFWKKEDLQRIYGVDSTLYAGLKPYIRIPARSFTKRTSQKSFPPKSYERKAPPKIEVNSAGVEEWQRLYGIGPVLSKRIVKFRDALGGFRSIEQVGETYGLADSVFQQIRSQLVLKEGTRRIDINRCTLEALAGHPYINWKLARRIISYRQQHGPFEDLEELEGIKELPEDFWEQVGEYLEVGDKSE